MGIDKAAHTLYFEKEFKDLIESRYFFVEDANYYAAKAFYFSLAKLLSTAFGSKWYRHLAVGALGSSLFGVHYYISRPSQPSGRFLSFATQMGINHALDMTVGSYVGDAVAGQFVSIHK